MHERSDIEHYFGAYRIRRVAHGLEHDDGGFFDGGHAAEYREHLAKRGIQARIVFGGESMRRVETPWGLSDDAGTEEAPGIVWFTTPGHGGYRLSPARQERVKQLFPEFDTFAGGPWYEEDQDWAVVALAFADELTKDKPALLRGAIQTARCSAKDFNFGTKDDPQIETYPHWKAVCRWLDETEAGKSLCERVRLWEASQSHVWECLGGHGPVKGYPKRAWGQHFRRVGDGKDMTVVLREYPNKAFYTLDEIESLRAEPEPEPEQKPKPVSVAFDPSECGGVFDGFGVYSDADPGL